MTVSQKQLEANRRNAQKSTDPKTPEVKVSQAFWKSVIVV